MRARTWLSCVAVLGLGLVSVASAQQGIRWQPNLETARKLAAQTNRLVLIHFWTESCEHCVRMDRDVFSRTEVAAAIEPNYVAVKVNTRHYPVTAQQFGITGLPADVVVTPDGKVIEKNMGYVPAPQYVGRLNQIAANMRGQSGPGFNTAGGFNPSAGGNPGIPSAANPTAVSSSPAANPAGTPSYGGVTGPGYANPTGRTPQMAGRQPNPSGVQSPAQSQVASTPPWQQDSAGQKPASPSPPYQAPQFGMNQGTSMPPQTPDLGRYGRPDAAMSSPSGAAGMAQQPPDRTPNGPSEQSPNASWQPGQGRGNPMIGRAGEANVADGGSQSRPSGNPPLALDGYCCVTLVEKQHWVKGNPLYGVIHMGRTYLFAGSDEARRFYDDPERFSPINLGNDPVVMAETGQVVAGCRKHGDFYNGRIYLFSSAESREKFERDPAKYATPPASPPTSTARRTENPAGNVPDNGSAAPGGYEFDRRSPSGGDPSGASRPWAPTARY